MIDVVRATTTIIEALANGARAIYPTDSTEEAVKLASSMGREDTLLCGERRGHKVEGFDLGNSPREFTSEAVVDGKKLVMSTTNGTRAFSVGREGRRLLPCAFTNLGAVAGGVAETSTSSCAVRRKGRLASRWTTLFAPGHLIKRGSAETDEGGPRRYNDAAMRAALGRWRHASRRDRRVPGERLRKEQRLIEIGSGR